MLPRLAFLLKPRQRTPKHFEYDQIKIKIFGFKRCGYKANKKRKAKNHKLPSSRHFLKLKMSFLVKFPHKFPLFSTDFQLSSRMLIFRKQTRKQRFPSCLPLAKYLDFYDVSKNSELIKTFQEARLKSHPPKFKSLTFLNRKS